MVDGDRPLPIGRGRDRQRSPGRRERQVDVVVDPACRGDAQHLPGAALEQGDVLELLEGIAVGLIAAQFLPDRDHRDRCLKGLGEPGDEQRPVARERPAKRGRRWR
ncbi:MAG: hypothetical protein K0S96_2364 [Geminicoccaceae bacterium]|nr:hypothetical protein [Geminicoccaceae bacterium]